MADSFSYNNLAEKLVELSEWTPKQESIVVEPFRYCTLTSGKEIRPKLIEAFNIWLNVPEQELQAITRIVSKLHNASLLVDDIEDDSQLRRGRPVAHKIYGIPQTINTANYIYFQAFQELSALQSLTASRGSAAISLEMLVNEELLSLHRGQGLELFWRDSLNCPTEEEYVGMVNNKTGGLFRMAVKLMASCATTNKDVDYIPLISLFGILFQIRDDYMNLQSDEYNANKGFAEDLTEGKFSFPLIHGIRAKKEDRQILSVLQKRPTTPTLKRHVINSMKYTLDVVKNLEGQVRQEILRLGGNAALEAIVDALAI
ncbi:terpenoid synthase [Flagelloscypha sp. PMI_526]|nr:terpenoid synthase [Flagelloscypha sp. PMI_526]